MFGPICRYNTVIHSKIHTENTILLVHEGKRHQTDSGPILANHAMYAGTLFMDSHIGLCIFIFIHATALSQSRKVWTDVDPAESISLQWRHNRRDSVSNHQPHDCLFNRLFADQRKHQSSASLAFVRGIHRRPLNSPHKWQVTRKISPFDDVIMIAIKSWLCASHYHILESHMQIYTLNK